MASFKDSLGGHTILLASSAIVALVLIGVLAYSPAIASDSTTTVTTTETTPTTITSTSTETTTQTSTVTSPTTTTQTTTVTSAFTSPTTITTTTTTSSKTSGSGNSRVIIPFDAGNNESLNFQPSTIRVVIGINNTIVWENDDPLQHTVTSSSVPAGAQRFNSGILNQGQTFSLTLTVPGTYHYFCTIHPTWMRGTIQVVG